MNSMVRILKNIKLISQGFIGIAIILGAITIGIDRLDLTLMFQSLGRVNLLHMAVATAATVGVMALSTVRFAYINKKFGGDEDWLFLHRVNMLSLLYAQIALPLITQIIGRISHGSEDRRIFYAPLTVLEKSVAFTIMILFGGTAFFALLNQNIIPQGLPQALTLMGVTMLVVLGIGLMLFFDKAQRKQLWGTLLKISSIGIFSILSLSVLIQLGILLIYTVLALQFVPDSPLITLIGSFAIVVLATSIPIGFGGWGVREAAAAGIFFALGMPPEIGVVVGLLYGFMHLITLGFTVLLLLRRQPVLSSVEASSKAPSNRTISTPFAGVNFWPLTFFLIMALLPFQIRFPLANNLITLNSVDLIALVVMINFILLEYIKGHIRSIWTDHLTWIGIGGFVIMIVIGWVVGWLRFGSNEWATANRLIGLIPVLSYLFAGAAMRRYISPDMMARLAMIFAFSMVMTVLVKLISHNIFGFQSPIFFNWINNLAGFIANQNAFSFMVGMSCVLLIMHWNDFSQPILKHKNFWAIVLLSMLLTFVVYTGSRSGIGASAIVLFWMVLTMPRALPLVGLTVALTTLMLNGINFIQQNEFIVPMVEHRPISLFNGRPISNFFGIMHERHLSLTTGILLFEEFKIFGGGLGASINRIGLDIHNLYLWILGEMGLIGAALCLPMVVAFFRTIMCRIKTGSTSLIQNREFHAIAVFILICGGFSLVQDIVYQRVLWLVVGFLMAQPFQSAKTATPK